jgi:NADH:ubiquinone oxidoreductase subunit 3 (subunit A)
MACRAACRRITRHPPSHSPIPRARQRVSTQEEPVVALGYLFAAIFFIGGVGFVIVALTVADLLNALLLKRRPAKDKLTTYESGETPIGSAWVQYPLAFYIFALLFVAFDVDIVFILAWAVIFQQLSLFGFIEIVFFILTLALGLVYAWRKGVIRWI